MTEAAGEYTWTVTTHEHKERSNDWYWALGSIAVLGAGMAVFFGNGLLAIILIIGLGSIGFLAARGPREHTVRLGPRGVSVDGTRYPWEGVHSFWVEHEVAEPRLFLSMSGVLSPHITVELENTVEGDKLREYLKQFAKEEEHGPRLGENLAELFGL